MKMWYRWKIFFLFLLLGSGVSHAQNITGEKISRWKGFEKVEFKIDSFLAFYVKPLKPLAGNPWVWRAYFPNWHTEVDSILVSRGFHLAYINTNDLFGHPKAMQAWDDFYDYLTMQKKFSSRVALEGVSRGGLYVYGWAKRNPSRVSCIYAEAPVCDFTSWPGGKGKGMGAPGEWKKLLEVYGLTGEQALQYDDQPKDNLEGLAAFKVPILHTIGLKDSIVPAEESSFILANNYARYGGPVTIIPMTRSKQEDHGHHFAIENPEVIAGFINQNSVNASSLLPTDSFIHAYGTLDNFLYRIREEKSATIAFLGGSITHMNGWRNKVMQYFRESYPGVQFTFINAGIPSLGSMPHAFRLRQDVLDKGKVDLLFFESAVNDLANKTTVLQQRRAIEGVIRHAYASNPYIGIVVMAFADEAKIAGYNNGQVPAEVKVHDELSAYYHLPFINLAEEVSKRIINGEFTWEYDFKNIHPSPFGMEIYFNAIRMLLRKTLVKREAPSQLTVVKVPEPLQKLNYATADYTGVDKATNKNGFAFIPSWRPSDSVKTRPGFVNVPMLVGETPGASFDLEFTGTTVGIATVSGPDAGTIFYSVDGKAPVELDTYNRYSRSLHLPQYFLLADDLRVGKHVLHITISGKRNKESKGSAVRIVHFLINH